MAADLLSLLTSIPSLMADFSGSTTAPYNKQQEALAGQQMQLSQAMMQGPNNPLYQQLYGQYQQQNANNMAQSIAEAQGQNRMNANMGRTPLFSNERGSENIFRSMMQNYQNAGVQADQQTRQALMGAAQPTMQANMQYNSISPTTANANKQQLQGYQSIYDLLRGGGTGSSGAGNYSAPSGNYQSMMMQPQQSFVPQPSYSGYNF